MKIRVPVLGTVNKSVQIETDAPSRAEVTAAISAAIAANRSSGGSSSSVVTVIWRFIREVPANIVKLAALATAGLITRKSDGTILTRSIAVADTSRLTVMNGDGSGGNPTLDMADISARSAWGRPNNTTGKPVAIQSTGDKAVLHESGGALSFDVINASYIQASATSRVFGRKTASAGNGEELTLSDVLDFIGSAAQGDILYRGASTWARLAAGTSGYVLSTQGAGANPQWIAASSGGGGNITPDTHPTSPNAVDDEFEAGSLDAKWTITRGTFAASSLGQGALYISDTSNSADNWAGYGQSITGNFKIRCKMWVTGESQDNRGGIYVARGGNKFMLLGVFKDGGNFDFYCNKQTSTSSSATNLFISSSGVSTALARGAGPFYLQIEYDGTNVKFYGALVGYDAYFSASLSSEAVTTFLGGAPDEIGVYCDRGSSNGNGALFDWFRGGF